MNEPTARPLAKPRRQIGPDAILMLKNVALQNTGNRFEYHAARVQRDRYGGPSRELNFAQMETVGIDHPDSYQTLIAHRIMPEAKRLATRMAQFEGSHLAWSLQVLLKKACCEDSEAWWLLSAPPIRAILFPNAYKPDGLRADRIVYRDIPGDLPNCGKTLHPYDLTPANVHRFVQHATALTNGHIDPKTITPLTFKGI